MHLVAPNPSLANKPLDDFFAHDGKIALLYGNASLTQLALYGITLITTQGYSVMVLDGANSFNAYTVARHARLWGFAPDPILERILLSRAFTGYQMKELVTQRLASVLGPPQETAVFCLGLLDTFYDEDIALTDAVRMVKLILATFTMLTQRGYTILITAREPRAEQTDRQVLLNLLMKSAHRVEHIHIPTEDETASVKQPYLLVA